jgi:hypothetical protein
VIDYPTRFVAPANAAVARPEIAIRLHVADRAYVEVGDSVTAGQPLAERFAETFVLEVPASPELRRHKPWDEVSPASLPRTGRVGRQHARAGDRVRMLYIGPDDVARVVIGRGQSVMESPLDGVVAERTDGALVLAASGVGMRARVGWGQPVRGPLLLGVTSPDAELRASAIDIGAAGSVLVAGARLDIEAVTRARAIGVAGIICGGIVGRELRQLDEADARQRAAFQPATPFGLLTMDGYGRRPIPALAWDMLVAAAGSSIGLVPEARLAILGVDPAAYQVPARPPGSVRITAGEGIGEIGTLVGLAGPQRRVGGLYQPSGYVDGALSGNGDGRRIVPLADLERLG